MSNVGFTLSALWTIRDIPRGVLGGNAKYVLNTLISFANAMGHIEVDVMRLSSAADMGKTTLMREIDRLALLGVITIIRRGTGSASSVYRVELEKLSAMKDVDAPPVRSQSPRGASLQGDVVRLAVPGSEYERGEDSPRVGEGLVPGWEPGGAGLGPIEDLEERYEDLLEDHASPPLASPQAPSTPTAPPTTARSPATMLTPSQTLLTSDATREHMPSPPPKQRKPRATKPKLAPLTAEQLTAYEREVHDAIVGDPTLVQICHNVPQLARDLVGIAAGRLDVVAKVRALGAWNRNNPSKAWTTAGGNRGLTSCVTRDAGQVSSGYASTRSSYQQAPANHAHAPPAPRVQIVAPPPPPRDDFPKPLPGEETFLQRMARIDPQARRILEQNGKPQQ